MEPFQYSIANYSDKIPGRIYNKLIDLLAKHESTDAQSFLHRALLALVLSTQNKAISEPQYSLSAVQDGLDREYIYVFQDVLRHEMTMPEQASARCRASNSILIKQ